MKQVIQDIGSGETTVVEVPVPAPGPGMALVRTAASVVSAGTERMLVEFGAKSLMGKARARPDLVRQVLDKARREGVLTAFEAVRGRLAEPVPLGYSSAGTVVALGEDMASFRVGERVACAGGGYAVHAEFAIVPRNLLARLPEAVDFESGAFATLGAIALHGFRLAGPQVGERVVVIGLGLIGRLALAVARASGCVALGIDVDPRRVAEARAQGFEAVERKAAEAAAATYSRGAGFDAVLICAETDSDDPVTLAGVIARDRAAVVAIGAVGLGLPRKLYYEKELRFFVSRSYGPGRYDPAYEEGGRDYPTGYVRWTEGRNLEAFLDLLASGSIEVRSFISHRFNIDQAPQAYRLIAGRTKQPFLGVLLTYPERAPEMGRRVVTAAAAQPSGPVRLGALGAGNFATTVLFPLLGQVRGVERVGVATARGLKAAQAARRYGFAYAASTPDEILADPSVNTVAILTRHHLHARQTIAALNAGKHVFCEKPLALTREELGLVMQTQRAAGRLLMVGFNRRFAPLVTAMRAFLSQAGGPLLLTCRVNAGPLPPGHWLQDPKQGGGRIIGEVCHFVDLFTYLTTSLPVRVHASGLPGDSHSAEEDVSITLTFADGSVGTIVYAANGDRLLPKERVEAFGGGHVAVLDDFRALELYAGGRRQVERSGLRQDKGHRAAWEAFARAVEAGGPAPIPLEEIFAVTQATFAAVESLRTGQPEAVDLTYDRVE
jgi:predicted dehydrogenase